MKNDLTAGAWQHDIGCPISITLLSTSDGGSPGHAALGDAICIAPAHPQGLQNWPQRRCILMSSLILSLTITIAK